MKEDIFAKMTADTRAMLQQMQANTVAPPPNADPVQLARDGYRQTILLAGAVETVETKAYTVASATPTIPLRLYRPQTESGGTSRLPALVYFHGGGFISGDFDTHDRPLRALSHQSGCVIVAVEYRLAPEFPFPAAPEDCATFQWVVQNVRELSIDAANIAVGGDSAGGLLATVVCLMCRDRNVGQPAAQILIYPNTDLASDTASWHELAFLHPSQSRENFIGQVTMYVPDANDRAQLYASPLRAPDLADLPPALLITAELDAQRDAGEAYAQRLREASCLVTHTRYPGVIHGFFQMGGVVALGKVAIAEVAAYLRLRFSLVS